MSSDIFTKNVGGRTFFRHRDVYVREDPTSTMINPVGEGVGIRIRSTESTQSGTGLSINEQGSKHIGESSSAGTEVVEVEAAVSERWRSTGSCGTSPIEGRMTIRLRLLLRYEADNCFTISQISNYDL
jgi:hypothetical protein